MTAKEDKNSKSKIQVISRAAAILRVLKETQDGMSLGQIAEKVDLPRSTVQRIAGALVAENFISQDEQGRGLRLGPELSALAGSATFNIVEHCRLLLTELTQKTGETADLSAMRGVGMTFLDQVPGMHRLRTVSSVGDAFPLTTTANGRAALALMDDERVLKLAQAEWQRTGSAGDGEAFMQRIEQIRKDGCLTSQKMAGVCLRKSTRQQRGGTQTRLTCPLG